MKELSSEVTSLLDRLYNLRGENSVILLDMEKEREIAVETRERTSALKSSLEEKIESLKNEERMLAEEGQRLSDILAMAEREEYAKVLECLNIEFDPSALKNRVDDALPATIENLMSDRMNASDELIHVEDEMNASIAKIEELGIRRDEALVNQDRLNRYFELALNSNINITRDEICSLIASFGFNEDEQREAAKLLMFPEDGLFDYEEHYKDRPLANKSIGEVIAEAKESAPIVDLDALAKEIEESLNLNLAEEPTVEPIVQSEPVVEETAIIDEPTVEDIVLTENVSEAIVEPVEETAAPSKESLIKLLTDLGFDYLDFTNNDFATILESYDEATIIDNVNLINELNINKDVFNDNVELFNDKELRMKVEKLTSVGKAPQDIYLNPNVLVKYDLNGLDSAIKTLHESGLEPKNVPLMAY